MINYYVITVADERTLPDEEEIYQILAGKLGTSLTEIKTTALDDLVSGFGQRLYILKRAEENPLTQKEIKETKEVFKKEYRNIGFYLLQKVKGTTQRKKLI